MLKHARDLAQHALRLHFNHSLRYREGVFCDQGLENLVAHLALGLLAFTLAYGCACRFFKLLKAFIFTDILCKVIVEFRQDFFLDGFKVHLERNGLAGYLRVAVIGCNVERKFFCFAGIEPDHAFIKTGQQHVPAQFQEIIGFLAAKVGLIIDKAFQVKQHVIVGLGGPSGYLPHVRVACTIALKLPGNVRFGCFRLQPFNFQARIALYVNCRFNLNANRIGKFPAFFKHAVFNFRHGYRLEVLLLHDFGEGRLHKLTDDFLLDLGLEMFLQYAQGGLAGAESGKTDLFLQIFIGFVDSAGNFFSIQLNRNAAFNLGNVCNLCFH